MYPMPKDDNGIAIPVPRWGASQDVAFTGTAALAAAFASGTRVLRLVANGDCRIAGGSAPVAVATSTLLPAFHVEFITVEAGEKLSVLQDSAAGNLNITEIA